MNGRSPVSSRGVQIRAQNSALSHGNAYARAVEEQVTRYLTIGSGVAVAATYAMDPFEFKPSRSTSEILSRC